MAAGPVGDLLDERYELGAVIGVGGMGEVRAGFDRKLDREVAVKFLRAELAQQGEVRDRFEQEARSAARISHPSAVTVFDSGEADGVPYLITERLPGHSLADRLLEGPLPAGEVVAITRDVLAALSAAHRLGIVHRDVKPGNLLYTDEGRVKLADFGIAKSTEALDQTMTGQVIGTPAYLAPERLRGMAATPASDLYSVGVVMYEALTGQKPFRADTPIALAYAIDSEEPQPVTAVLPTVDRRLATAIDRSLRKDPAERYGSAEEMIDAITERDPPATADSTVRVASGEHPPTAVLPPVTADPMASTWRERLRPLPRTWLVVGVGLLAVAVLLAVRGGGERNDPPAPSTSLAPATTPLPEPLERAITDLERSVDP